MCAAQRFLAPRVLEQTGENLPFKTLPERFQMWKLPGWEWAVTRLLRGLIRNDCEDYPEGGQTFGHPMRSVFESLLIDGERCASRLSHMVFGGVQFIDITEDMRPGYPTTEVSRYYRPVMRAAYKYLVAWGLKNRIVIVRGDGGGPGYPMGDSGSDLHAIATELRARVPAKSDVHGNDLDLSRIQLYGDFDVLLYQVLAKLPQEAPNRQANASLIVRGQTSIHDRYAVLATPASMAIVMPGGYGTADETTNMDILNQFCGKVDQKTFGPRLQIQLDCEVPYAEEWGLPKGMTYFQAQDLARRVQISRGLSRLGDELRVRFRVDRDTPEEVGRRLAETMIEWHRMTEEFRRHEARVIASALENA